MSQGVRGVRQAAPGVDGVPAAESPMAEPLAEAGFIRTTRGFLKRLGG